MRRTAKELTKCPMHELLEVLARPWTLEILWALNTNGPTRFGALRRRVEGISPRVLAQRLRLLEQQGFVFRDYKPTIPPSVTYGITKRMKDISKVLADLDELGRKWQHEDTHRRAKAEDAEFGAHPGSVQEVVHS